MKLMLDSGAHSLFNEYTRGKGRDFSFFESDVFWEFVDKYCAFLIENKENFDLYVSVDVIFNPELSWKVQKYMESKGLSPLPVFHVGEDFKWLKRYIDNYDYVGLGGLGQTTSKKNWIVGMGDPAFSMICDDKGMPRIKTHGFAMTSPDLVIQYPWFSVDSTSWFQFGKYGLIIVPKKKNGSFRYDESPHIISVSSRKKRKADAENFDHLPDRVKEYILEYIESKGLSMGKSELKSVAFDKKKPEFHLSDNEISEEEIVIEEGVCNSMYVRDELNLQYYLDLEANIPPWPRPWKKKIKTTHFKL